MSTLQNEMTLLTFNDHSITLTTHRLLQRTSTLNKEIMLTDFLSFEIVSRRSRFFRGLLWFFVLTTTALGIWCFSVHQRASQWDEVAIARLRQLGSRGSDLDEQIQISTGLLGFSAVLLGISLLLFLIIRSRVLRISGKFSEINIPTAILKNDSLNRFVNTLVTESDNRKREK